MRAASVACEVHTKGKRGRDIKTSWQSCERWRSDALCPQTRNLSPDLTGLARRYCCYLVLIFIRHFLREHCVFSLKRWHIWISFTCHPLLFPFQMHSALLPENCQGDERSGEIDHLESGYSLQCIIFLIDNDICHPVLHVADAAGFPLNAIINHKKSTLSTILSN